MIWHSGLSPFTNHISELAGEQSLAMSLYFLLNVVRSSGVGSGFIGFSYM